MVEAEVDQGGRAFGGEALSPGGPAQAIAELGFGGALCKQAEPADE